MLNVGSTALDRNEGRHAGHRPNFLLNNVGSTAVDCNEGRQRDGSSPRARPLTPPDNVGV